MVHTKNMGGVGRGRRSSNTGSARDTMPACDDDYPAEDRVSTTEPQPRKAYEPVPKAAPDHWRCDKCFWGVYTPNDYEEQHRGWRSIECHLTPEGRRARHLDDWCASFKSRADSPQDSTVGTE